MFLVLVGTFEMVGVRAFAVLLCLRSIVLGVIGGLAIRVDQAAMIVSEELDIAPEASEELPLRRRSRSTIVVVVRILPPLGWSIRVGPPRTPRRDSRTHVRVLAPAVVTNAGVPARIDEQLLDPFRIEASAEKLCGRGPRWMLQTGSHGARAGVPVQALTSSVFRALSNKTPHVRVARRNFRPPVAEGAPVDDVVV